MPTDPQPAPTPAASHLTLKRIAIGLVFAAILMIPRIRRLRRNVRRWTALRAVAAIVSVGLIVSFARGKAGLAPLIVGVVLAGFAILFAARPEKKSVDARSRELNALVALNGGIFVADSPPGLRAHLFVTAHHLLALSEDDVYLAVIPLAALRSARVHSISSALAKKNKSPRWELEVAWEADGARFARFLYEGVFAEHLARIAERTLTSLWKKELPVLPSS